MNRETYDRDHKRFAFETPESIREFQPTLTLRFPEDEDFFLYTEGTTQRARSWALDGGYVLVDSGYPCAHDIWRAACPTQGCRRYSLDHTQLWVSKRGYGEPFLLTQPYPEEVPDDLTAYAQAHGLRLDSNPWDGWYSPRTLPVRMTFDSPGASPLEVELHDLLYKRTSKAVRLTARAAA